MNSQVQAHQHAAADGVTVVLDVRGLLWATEQQNVLAARLGRRPGMLERAAVVPLVPRLRPGSPGQRATHKPLVRRVDRDSAAMGWEDLSS